MRADERRVAITGLGLVSPLGWDLEPATQKLYAGESAVRPIEAFEVGDLTCRVGGEVPGLDAKSIKALSLPRLSRIVGKQLKFMARDIQLAVVAAQRAWADAGLEGAPVDPARVGIDLGAGNISTDLEEFALASDAAMTEGGLSLREWGAEGLAKIQPIWMLRYLPNMLACHVSILLDCRGPSNSITLSDAAATVAMTEAARLVARDRADVMITGGADSKIHPMSLVRMQMMGLLSSWVGPPAEAAGRPFDRDACGSVPGEGGGLLIFEELEHARRRGARIYGEVLGWGSGCDAAPDGGTSPDGRGMLRAIKSALADSGVTAAELGHVHAHGSGLPAMDRSEAAALEVALEGVPVPITATKGQIGNLASGAGGVETILSLLAAGSGFVPAIPHCEHPIAPLNFVRGTAAAIENRTFLKTSYARNGQAAALVIRAGEPES